MGEMEKTIPGGIEPTPANQKLPKPPTRTIPGSLRIWDPAITPRCAFISPKMPAIGRIQVTRAVNDLGSSTALCSEAIDPRVSHILSLTLTEPRFLTVDATLGLNI